MQEARARGGAGVPSKRSATVPATDDEIREKYLERAIRELNQLTHELQDRPHCPRGKLMPVLGSGHPQADVFMVKHAAGVAEIEEGVAFYGRAGNALIKASSGWGSTRWSSTARSASSARSPSPTSPPASACGGC